MKEQVLDNIDRKILHALQSDARTSFRKLAADIGLSATPVLQRVKRLEQAGVIRAYRADIDPQQLGLGMLAYVEVALDQTTVGSFDQFERDIQDIDNILECHMVAGGFDYFLKARVADMVEYRWLLQRLAAIEGLRQTHTYIVMEEIKCERQLPIRE